MKNELTFASKPENINIVEKLVDEISAEFNLSSEIYGNILVATVEAVNNAILHGNKMDPRKMVRFSFSVENNCVTFIIKDEGPGFNYNRIPDPTLPENIEKPHGRGIFLMKHLVDDINFLNNGAEVELKFKF
jgi:serine/threonine-protein kinase RsbW